jgi:tellurite resistance protein TerC
MTPSIRTALSWSLFWIALSFLFGIFIYFERGAHDALNFFTGYLIEKSLSIDNLFVFLLIFKTFKTPEEHQKKVLTYGLIGAITLRALFIWLGIQLIQQFHFVIYLFGLFLIYSGLKVGFQKSNTFDPKKNWLFRFFPLTHEYHGDKFFFKKKATPLFLALLSVESTDLIFAIDSIPAILAITTDPFIVYTSNIFAILGLRSLYFTLSHLLNVFHYLHYAITFMLVFTGCKMLLSSLIEIPTILTLVVILLSLGASILASIYKEKS